MSLTLNDQLISQQAASDAIYNAALATWVAAYADYLVRFAPWQSDNALAALIPFPPAPPARTVYALNAQQTAITQTQVVKYTPARLQYAPPAITLVTLSTKLDKLLAGR
jgi:hypothetical protein